MGKSRHDTINLLKIDLFEILFCLFDIFSIVENTREFDAKLNKDRKVEDEP